MKCFCIVAKRTYYLRYMCLSAGFSAWLPFHVFHWNRILGTFVKICWENPVWLKSVQSAEQLTWSPMDDPMLPATLYRHKSAVFQRSWFRFLVYPKRYKHYTKASEYQAWLTVLSCTKLTRSGSPNVCKLYLSTQTFSWLIGIFVTRSLDTGWNTA